MLQKVSVKEYARLKNVSEKTIYNWIDSGRLEYVEERVQNRPVKFILVSAVQVDSNEYNENFTEISEPSEQNKTLHHHIPDNKDLLDFMKSMTVYIEAAGQVKLLTDSERRTQQQYFELNQENKQLLQEKTELKIKLDMLQDKNSELEKQLEKQKEELQKQFNEETSNTSLPWWKKL